MTPPDTSRHTGLRTEAGQSGIVDVDAMADSLIAEHGAGSHDDCRAPIMHAVIEKVEAAAATPACRHCPVAWLHEQEGYPLAAAATPSLEGTDRIYAAMEKGAATAWDRAAAATPPEIRGAHAESCGCYCHESAETTEADPAAATPSLDATTLLRRMLDNFGDDPCRLDHHGYCQAHMLEDTTEDYCTVKATRAFLARLDEGSDR